MATNEDVIWADLQEGFYVEIPVKDFITLVLEYNKDYYKDTHAETVIQQVDTAEPAVLWRLLTCNIQIESITPYARHASAAVDANFHKNFHDALILAVTKAHNIAPQNITYKKIARRSGKLPKQLKLPF